jgi:segregation and condensation protein A
MTYQVHLENFEGPLDLLLYFIQRDEIDIHDIPIAHITAEYLRYLEVMEALNLAIAGEFILLAATLMRIKSARGIGSAIDRVSAV